MMASGEKKNGIARRRLICGDSLQEYSDVLISQVSNRTLKTSSPWS